MDSNKTTTEIIQETQKQVLYRKWRSRDFDEIVGQSHVVRTLKNAIASGRIASAYLFSGPRGTGKTSMARIFAKAINCPNVKDGEPCNKCHSCKSISAGSFLDIIEMDAASHTQVEKIREFIVEKVNFRPTEGKKKVYIIDEVHKLSAFSFDALLKTIEEPPPFVVFILATTEPDKLPPTILSRCQRFDFKRISVKHTVERLKEISKAEKFEIEEGALNLIAEASEGALRDALVILEQAASFSTDEVIRSGDIISLLGMTRLESLFGFADLIIEKNTAKALEFVDEMYRDGKDLQRLSIDLLEHFRRLLIIQLSKEAEAILEISSDMYKKLSEQAYKFKPAHLMHIMKELIELRKMLKETGLDRPLWEMSAIKLTCWEITPSIDSLSRKIAEIEKRIAGGSIEIIREERKPPQVVNVYPAKNLHAQEDYEIPVRKLPEPEKPDQGSDEEINYKSVEIEVPAAGEPAARNDNALWHQFLREVKKEKVNLLPLLQNVGPGKITGDEYRLRVDSENAFNRDYIEKHRKYIESILSRLFGKKLSLRLESTKIDKLFQNEEKSHNAFVDEVRGIFGASPVDRPVSS